MELLVQLNEGLGITIAMVTHEPDMAEFVSRVIVFRDGRIVEPDKVPSFRGLQLPTAGEHA